MEASAAWSRAGAQGVGHDLVLDYVQGVASQPEDLGGEAASEEVDVRG